jgi:hypothetical protein
MRVKYLIIFLFAFGLACNTMGNPAKKLSNYAKISLLTCGPGDAVYSMFGHSALWVFDPQSGIDRVYNYGTFDFYSNRFYIEFIRGTAMYHLSITNIMSFQAEYVSENRSIEEQVLNLEQQEKQILYERLEENYKPENRYYRYDFLFQNCSSLIRDVVWDVTGNRFKIPEISPEDHTYRSMMVPYLEEEPWLLQAIFVVLGHKTDLPANPWNQMYLPDYMFDWFDAAINSDGESLVSETRTLFLPLPRDKNQSFFFAPVPVLSLLTLIVLAISVFEVRRKKKILIIDSILLFITGIAGLLLFYMWVDSLHDVTHQNINLLWAFPLHFMMAIILWFKKLRPVVVAYAKILAPVAIFFLLFFWLLPQTFAAASLYLSAIMSIILVKWGYLFKAEGKRQKA